MGTKLLPPPKNEHLLKLPPSVPNVSWDPRERPKIITSSRHQKLSITQEGQLEPHVRQEKSTLSHGRNKTQKFEQKSADIDEINPNLFQGVSIYQF